MVLAQIPKEQAALIDLAFFQGMTHSEIASATQLPLGTVKTRLRTGLQRLRELWLESVNQASTQP
jgi:RNA polymerase sigma-70 factor (ECF subfamily)